MKRPLFKFFIITGTIALILLALGIVLLSLIISKQKIEVEPLSLNYPAWFSVNQKMNKEMKFIKNGKNLSANRTVIVTKQEANAMFYMAVTANNTYKQDGPNYNVQYMNFSGNDFTVYFSLDIEHKTPFGNIINCRLRFIPQIEDGTIKVDIESMRIGELPIPAKLVNYFISSNDDKINNNKPARDLLSAVKSFSIERKSLKIVYKPENMMNLLSGSRGLDF